MKNARLAAHSPAPATAGASCSIRSNTRGSYSTIRSSADAKRRSWVAYADEARRRGRELMTAFQKEFPDLIVFVTFGHSLLWEQSEHGKKTLAECRYGLLVPFLDGMIGAAGGRARIVDGHEMSYGYRDADAFTRAHRTIKEDSATLAEDGAAYRRTVSAGFGLWLDYDWREKGWDIKDPEKNYFSPVVLRDESARRDRASRRVRLDLYREAAMVVAEWGSLTCLRRMSKL